MIAVIGISIGRSLPKLVEQKFVTMISKIIVIFYFVFLKHTIKM